MIQILLTLLYLQGNKTYKNSYNNIWKHFRSNLFWDKCCEPLWVWYLHIIYWQKKHLAPISGQYPYGESKVHLFTSNSIEVIMKLICCCPSYPLIFPLPFNLLPKFKTSCTKVHISNLGSSKLTLFPSLTFDSSYVAIVQILTLVVWVKEDGSISSEYKQCRERTIGIQKSAQEPTQPDKRISSA